MINNRKLTGDYGECVAENYLISKGISFVFKNYRSKYGEIDIIGKKDKYIIFIEVKTRRKNSAISGIECVTLKKRERIIKTACIFIQENNIKTQPRFDIIEVKNDVSGLPLTIKHIENAFTMEGNYAFF